MKSKVNSNMLVATYKHRALLFYSTLFFKKVALRFVKKKGGTKQGVGPSLRKCG